MSMEDVREKLIDLRIPRGFMRILYIAAIQESISLRRVESKTTHKIISWQSADGDLSLM